MAFFECEFTRAIQFQRTGGQMFNTSVIDVASGHEQRDRNWTDPRAEYQASVITPASYSGNFQGFIDQLRTFFLLVGGRQDPFRYYDPVDSVAVNEPLEQLDTAGLVWQLQKTYTVGSRIIVRPISKPITSSVLKFDGTALANSVTVSGGTVSSIDYSSGQVTFSSAPTSPTASFTHHIPVRFNTDKFEIETQESEGGKIIKWNGLSLIEVRPPNY